MSITANKQTRDIARKLLQTSLSDVKLNGPTLNLIAVVIGVVAAYFMTIQSLEVELADKAERAVVETLDRRLTEFEVLLKQGVVPKDDFYRFSCDTETRLIRIEHLLTVNPGDSLGNH